MAQRPPEQDREPSDVGAADAYPVFVPHFRPRSRSGWIAVVAFLALFALAQPPFVHGLANRIEPWLLGLPFLYAYLLIIYCGLIAVLIWALRRGL